MEEVGKATEGKVVSGLTSAATGGLSSDSLARSVAAQLRGGATAKGKESSGGAAPKPGASGSAEGSTAAKGGEGSLPPGDAGSTQTDLKVGEDGEGKVVSGLTSAATEVEDGSGTTKEVWPESANKVVTGLRAERREARAKLEAMEKELQALKSGATSGKPGADGEKLQRTGAVQDAGATGSGPLADGVPKELVEAEATKRQVIGWAREATKRLRTDPDSVVAELAKNGVRLADTSPEGIADWLGEVRENATADLAKVGAQIELARGQAAQLAEAGKVQAMQVAHEYMPELSEKDSPRRQRYEQIMETHPELKGHPRGPLAAMVQVLGMEALDALMAQRKGRRGDGETVRLGEGTKGAGHQTARPPSKLPNGGGPAPVVGSGKKISSSELLARYQKSGLEADKTAWMKSMLS
jgi:hypothetical protein